MRRALAVLTLAVLAACAPKVPLEDKLALQPARFADLPGWSADAPSQALPAFVRSCAKFDPQPAERKLGGYDFAGTIDEWQTVCAAAAAVPLDENAARAFFETHFTPVAVLNHDNPEGLFTGYYEPSLQGSRYPSTRYTVPLYAKPADLVSVELGQFRDNLKGQRIAGRVVDGALRPYDDRAAIDAGALSAKASPLLWVDDSIDAFFLHIQGSGRVQLDNGQVVRVGYAGQNGHPYFAIGRALVERGALTPENVSMQSLRAWLAAHPGEASDVMHRNRSYVFFRELAGEGPVGAQGVALTPGRSLAVDRGFLPLGVPVWLDASRPDADTAQPDQLLRRLFIAQDTGGAIRGPVRGDVFWGHGPEAAAIAGRMKHPGRYWLLLPKPVAARLTPSG